MTQKFIKIILFVFVFGFVLVACGGETSVEEPAEVEVTPTATTTSDEEDWNDVLSSFPLPKGDGCPGTWEGARVESIKGTTATIALVLRVGEMAPEGWTTCVPHPDSAYKIYRTSLELTPETAERIKNHPRFKMEQVAQEGVVYFLSSYSTWQEFKDHAVVTAVTLTCFCADPSCDCGNE